MKKIRINNTITILLTAIAIFIAIFIVKKYIENQKNEKQLAEVVKQIESADLEEARHFEYEGYNVVGTIEIQKINIKYPILDITTDESMKKSVTKFSGAEINQTGNYVIAGHNNYDGTMFGKINKLEIGDIIEITDLEKNTIKYHIYKIYETNPNDVNCINCEQIETKEVTLITCINGNKNRLIIKSREI